MVHDLLWVVGHYSAVRATPRCYKTRKLIIVILRWQSSSLIQKSKLCVSAAPHLQPWKLCSFSLMLHQELQRDTFFFYVYRGLNPWKKESFTLILFCFLFIFQLYFKNILKVNLIMLFPFFHLAVPSEAIKIISEKGV